VAAGGGRGLKLDGEREGEKAGKRSVAHSRRVS
jgi:hypothetical protein